MNQLWHTSWFFSLSFQRWEQGVGVLYHYWIRAILTFNSKNTFFVCLNGSFWLQNLNLLYKTNNNSCLSASFWYGFCISNNIYFIHQIDHCILFSSFFKIFFIEDTFFWRTVHPDYRFPSLYSSYFSSPPLSSRPTPLHFLFRKGQASRKDQKRYNETQQKPSFIG